MESKHSLLRLAADWLIASLRDSSLVALTGAVTAPAEIVDLLVGYLDPGDHHLAQLLALA
jgi:hypothetical protein